MKLNAAATVIACGLAHAASAQTFVNTATIEIPAMGPASPYPSVISVSGVTNPIGSLSVTLPAFSHDRFDDVDILLVGPNGTAVVLMSDAGGTTNLSHVALTFQDGAPPLPDSGPMASGTFSPTDHEPGDLFPSPSPVGPFSTSLSAFNGLNANGDWQLFIVDDTGERNGKLRGWRLEITPIPSAGASALLLAAGLVTMRRRR